MKRRILMVLILLAVLTGTVFSQHKYKSFDMLLGVGWGLGVTTNFAAPISSFVSSLFNSGGESPSFPGGDYAMTTDFGLNLDLYVFPWLSLGSGVFAKVGTYVNIPSEISFDNITNTLETAKTPISVTVPLMAHINVPFLNFLYLGAGVAVNIPVSEIKFTEFNGQAANIGRRGEIFFSTPLEAGFDFVDDKGGGRFTVRVTPEFHKEGTYFPIGFMWQFHNFRIFSREERKDYSGYTEAR